tara:strand:- start:1441 stop:1623 length:183 start_codon:yes stop_codon:yes gene_type:complete
MNEREKMQRAELERIKKMLLENPEKLGPDSASRRHMLNWLDDEVTRPENILDRSHLKIVE